MIKVGQVLSDEMVRFIKNLTSTNDRAASLNNLLRAKREDRVHVTTNTYPKVIDALRIAISNHDGNMDFMRSIKESELIEKVRREELAA